MIWAHELLGVAADADAATIKRAYARLLRTTRPDEDAAAFQRLNTAYQTALAQVNRHQVTPAIAAGPVTRPARESSPVVAHAHPSETDTAEAAPPPEFLKQATPAPAAPLPPLEVLRPAAPPPAPTVNAMELAQRVIHESANAQEPSTLSHWLEHCPELWSFRVKQVTGQLMLQRQLREPQPMPAAHFDVLLRFFDLDHVLSGVNPVMLEQLRNRMAVRWEMLHDHAQLARRAGMFAYGQPQTWRLRNCLELLKHRRRWRSTITVALTRGQAAWLARISQILCNGHIKQLPAEIDQEHAMFWLRASGPHGSSLAQMTTGVIRALAFALICSVVIAILIATVTLDGNSSAEEWRQSALIPVIAFGAIMLGWLSLQGASWLDRWQCQSETASSARPWLRRFFIPAVGATALGLGCLGIPPWLAWSIMSGILFLTLRRYDQRVPVHTKRQIKLNPVALAYGLPLLAAMFIAFIKTLVDSINIPLLATAFVATLIVWGLDMRRHRAHWRSRRATT